MLHFFASEFGWTPEKIAELTDRQLLTYMSQTIRQREAEKQKRDADTPMQNQQSVTTDKPTGEPDALADSMLLDLTTPLLVPDLAKASGLPTDKKAIEALRKRLDRYAHNNKGCRIEKPVRGCREGKWMYIQSRVREVIDEFRTSAGCPPKKK